MEIKTILTRGHQVASGKAADTPFDAGTIYLQKPHFKKHGLNLEEYYMGTLNLDISPYKFEITNPSHTFEDVKWTENFPSETFSFIETEIIYLDLKYKAYVYYPHPETKIGHFKSNSIIEIIAPYIENIKYGDEVSIFIDQNKIKIFKS